MLDLYSINEITTITNANPTPVSEFLSTGDKTQQEYSNYLKFKDTVFTTILTENISDINHQLVKANKENKSKVNLSSYLMSMDLRLVELMDRTNITYVDFYGKVVKDFNNFISDTFNNKGYSCSFPLAVNSNETFIVSWV